MRKIGSGVTSGQKILHPFTQVSSLRSQPCLLFQVSSLPFTASLTSTHPRGLKISGCLYFHHFLILSQEWLDFFEMTISITEFKTHCLRILRDVEQSRQPIEISKQGRVRFRVIPVLEPQYSPWERLRGSGKLHASAEESVLSEDDFIANQ